MDNMSVKEYDALISIMSNVNSNDFLYELRVMAEMLEMDADEFHKVTGQVLSEIEPDDNDRDFDYGIPLGAKDYGDMDFHFCKTLMGACYD